MRHGSTSLFQLHSGKTNRAMENRPFEDVFPIENGDIPPSYVSPAEGKWQHGYIHHFPVIDVVPFRWWLAGAAQYPSGLTHAEKPPECQCGGKGIACIALSSRRSGGWWVGNGDRRAMWRERYGRRDFWWKKGDTDLFGLRGSKILFDLFDATLLEYITLYMINWLRLEH